MYRSVQLERFGLLNIDNNFHTFTLHSVFLQRIQAHLTDFSESWNRQGLSTEHGMMPRQLWLMGTFVHQDWRSNISYEDLEAQLTDMSDSINNGNDV